MIGPMARRTLASCFHPWWMVVALVSMGGVIALTHIPQDVLTRVMHANPHDKIEHVVAYGVVAALLLLSLRRPVPWVLLLALLCALAAVGALDEMTQPLVKRQASFLDYAADLVGIAGGCLILLLRSLAAAMFEARDRPTSA